MYSGPERRRHKMIITHNTEYHLRDQVCVAVRSRGSGEWKAEHSALRMTLFGSLRFGGPGGVVTTMSEIRVGERAVFIRPHHDVVTSLVEAVERPPKAALQHYLPPPD